jgi:hypothetical protein
MTRDEAIKVILDNHYPEHQRGALDPWCRQWCERTIDVFARLGMLKLDEPKSAEQKFIDACCDRDFHKPMVERIVDVIAAANLKIVEK